MQEAASTAPKPFVFVLMPFDRKYDDVYEFGIKGATADAAAYAERLDEQMFTGGMLDRIFNQISKADVIVADMTGRNPNVFYEVGYAHALDKVVILLTQTADDIPFDLRHRAHIIYEGSIGNLREKLAPQIAWAIAESRRRAQGVVAERLIVSVMVVEVPAYRLDAAATSSRIAVPVSHIVTMPVQVRNAGSAAAGPITHAYLLTKRDCPYVPTVKERYMRRDSVWRGTGFPETKVYEDEGWFRIPPLEASGDREHEPLAPQYRLPGDIPALPRAAVDGMLVRLEKVGDIGVPEAPMKVRLHTTHAVHDFFFVLELKAETSAETDSGTTE